MSLLTICQQVAEELSLYVPATIVNNTDDSAVRLLAVAQAEGKALARRHDWSVLQKEHTFSSVAAQAAYSLPSDFRSLIDGTVWNRTQYDSVRGGLSPHEWQQWKSSILGGGTYRDRFRLRPDSGVLKFYLDPTPDAVEDYVFEYLSDSWCKSSGGTAQTAWLADDDTGILDEYLMERGMIWRLQRALGHDYTDQRRDYEREVSRAIARDGGNQVLDMAQRKGVFVVRMPETGAG